MRDIDINLEIFMKTILSCLAVFALMLTLSSTAEAKNRKPKYICTGDCPGGGNSVDIFYDNDSDPNYDYVIHIDCDGKRTRQVCDLPDVSGNPVPTSGFFYVNASEELNLNTEIWSWTVELIRDGVTIFWATYDGSLEGEPSIH